MASLLIGLSVLSYDAIKKQNTKRKARKAEAANTPSFTEQERENAARIANLQSNSCFCERSDWQGGGCEAHGYVPAAGEPGGPPGYGDVVAARARERGREEVGEEPVSPLSSSDVGEEEAPMYRRRESMPPGYSAANAPLSTSQQAPRSPYRYQRGREDGMLAALPSEGGRARSMVDLSEGRAPDAMGEEEVRRINEERRRGMKAGGFTNFVLRLRKGGKDGGEGVVR